MGGRGLPAAVLGLLVAVLVVLAPPPRADGAASDGQAPGGVGPHTWSVEPTQFDLLTGPDGDLPVTIDADLWRPDDASATNPMPAIVHQHGYGGNKENAESTTNAAYFASHGYVVVTISTQGFGGSTGCIGLDSIDYDGSNVIGIIDWLAEQDYVATDASGDPQVGLLGGSYGGGHQGLVAVTDDRVDAIAPGRTWHTLQYSLVPNNFHDPAAPWDLDGYEQGVWKEEWTTLFYSLGLSQPAQGYGGCDPVTRQTRYPDAVPCAGYIPGICEIYAQLAATGDTDEAGRTLVGTSAIATAIDQLDTPTIIGQGLPDTLFHPNETVPWLLSLQARDVPVAVFWHSSGHGSYNPAPGDGEPYGGTFDDTPERQAEFADTYWARRHLAWFERHVRGRAEVDTGPTFAWFRDWVDYDVTETGGTSAPAYGTAEEYPPRQAAPTVLTLDPADATLAPAGAQLEGGEVTFLNPAGGQPADYSETANFSSPGQPGDLPATEVPGQFAEFLTAPFDEATDVVGVPELRLHLSHQAPTDAVLFAKLYDVDPDGNATLLRRQVAPARIPTAAMQAGPVDVHLVGLVHRFDAGHRARLVLSSTDQAYANNEVADQLTVSSTPDAPSTLTLPVVPAGAESSTGDGGGGTESSPDGEDTQGLAATGGGAAVAALALLGLAARLRRR